MATFNGIAGAARGFFFAAFLPAFISTVSLAQATATQVSGSLTSRYSEDGLPGTFDGTFKCTGEPICMGSYEMRELAPRCSNVWVFSDTLRITGLDLSRTGPLQGQITLAKFKFNDTINANGTCTIQANTMTDVTLPYTGQWDGSSGTLAFTYDWGGQSVAASFTGIFTASRSAPPPVFPMVVTARIDSTATASAAIQYRPQDVGTTQSVFVFAMAPATRVVGGQSSGVMKLGFARDERKADTPIGCVLAQLNAAGQMTAVTSANLAAYLTGVLSAQGASVAILNGVPTSNVSGATFFVGYGTSGQSMINSGVNRAAVTVPGSLTCAPAAPQTGWWWNPLEDGRGFSIEKRGNNLFFAAFLYDISGRSTWYVSSGPVSLDGTLYNGDLLSASGGQTLGGAYSRFPTLGNAGTLNMTFNNERTGTLVWAGGTVPIQRFNIIPSGLTAAPVAGVPESGWWWNESEAGRGFFMEWQGNTLDIAGYMYDDNGNSIWYLTVGEIGGTPAARSFAGNWWSYTGGQTLTGGWRQNTRSNSNVAPVTITFSGPDTALMTLPNGRATNLKRHRF